MESCTLKALALRPTRNIQGGHYFLILHTGRMITRFTWNTLSLPTYISKLVQRIVRRYSIALLFLDGLRLEVPSIKLDKDKANEYYIPGEEDYNTDDDDDDK